MKVSINRNGIESVKIPSNTNSVYIKAQSNESNKASISGSNKVIKQGYSPYIDENTNTWWTYDDYIREYKDTHISPEGKEGPQGIRGPQGIQGIPGIPGETYKISLADYAQISDIVYDKYHDILKGDSYTITSEDYSAIADITEDLVNDRFDNSMNNLQTNVDNLTTFVNTSIVSFRDELDQNAEYVSGFDSRIESNLSSIQSINGEIDSIKNNVESNSNELEHLTEELNSVNTRIDNVDDDIDSIHETINNLPTKLSEFTNDLNFIDNTVNDLVNYYKKSDTYTKEEINGLVDAIPKFSIQVVSSLPTENISPSVIYLLKENDETGNLYTEYIYVNNVWEILGSQMIDLSGYALKSEIPTSLSQLSSDSTHRLTTDSEKQIWNAKSDFSGDYTDLTNKPTVDSQISSSSTNAVQNKVVYSQLQLKQNVINDLDTIRQGAALGSSALQSFTESDPVYSADKPNIALKSEIPTKLSDLQNDNNYIDKTVSDLTNYYKKSETYTQSEINTLIDAIPKFSIEVKTALPTSNISSTTVYLINENGVDGNLYTEYIYVNNKWEILGSQRLDLSGKADTDLNNLSEEGQQKLDAKLNKQQWAKGSVIRSEISLELEWNEEFECYYLRDCFPSFSDNFLLFVFNGQEYLLTKNYVLCYSRRYYCTSFGGTSVTNKVPVSDNPEEVEIWNEGPAEYSWIDTTTPFLICSSWNSNGKYTIFANTANVTISAYRIVIDPAAQDEIEYMENFVTPLNTATGTSVAIGASNIAENHSVAIGDINTAKNYGYAFGYSSVAEGGAYAFGENARASEGGISIGFATNATGTGATAIGIMTEASADGAHAEGIYSVASGEGSHAEAEGTASGSGSHAEGGGVASGAISHAEGNYTLASGTASHTEGMFTGAKESATHAEGAGSIALGKASHVEGLSTIASGVASHVYGVNNVADTETGKTIAATYKHPETGQVLNIQELALGKYANIVGNGADEDHRSNAHTLDWDGNAWFAGDVYVGSTSGTNRDEGSKKLIKEGDLSTIAFSGSFNDLTDKPYIPEGSVVDGSFSDTSSNAVQNKLITAEFNKINEKLDEIELFKFPNATIVGIPNIESGQVSGFSNSNYMIFPFVLDVRNLSFEIGMCFTTGNNVTTQQNILDSAFGLALAIHNGKGEMALSSDGNSFNLGATTGTYAIQPNRTYYAKLTWDGSTYKTALSVDGETYTDDMIKVSSAGLFPTTIYIGGSYGLFGAGTAHPFLGSINMNKCYLKIGSSLIWQGMDDAGIATRADVSLSNLDSAGIKIIQDISKESVVIPTNVSSFVNDAGYKTKDTTYTFETTSTGFKVTPLGGTPQTLDVGSNITIDSSLNSSSTNPVQNKVIKSELDLKANTSSLSTVATSGSYNDLSDKPTIPTNISAFTNDSNYITKAVNDLTNYYKKTEIYTQTEVNNLISAIPKFVIEVVSSLPTSNISSTTVYLVSTGTETQNLYTEYIYVNSKWEKLGEQKVDLTGYAKSSEIPTSLSQLTADATHRLVTDTEKSTWNAKQSAISDLATIRSGAALGATALQSFTETDPTVPSWAKEANKPTYTASEVGARPDTWTPTKSDIGLGNVGNFKAVSTVASQGLTDTEKSNARTNIGAGTYSKPSSGIPLTDLASGVIPTNVSAFTNDAGYITADNIPKSGSVRIVRWTE